MCRDSLPTSEPDLFCFYDRQVGLTLLRSMAIWPRWRVCCAVTPTLISLIRYVLTTHPAPLCIAFKVAFSAESIPSDDRLCKLNKCPPFRRGSVVARQHELMTSFICCVLCVQDGWTALMSAAYSGHMKVVELLLEKGAKTDAINNVSRLSYLVVEYYTHVNCLPASMTRQDTVKQASS